MVGIKSISLMAAGLILSGTECYIVNVRGARCPRPDARAAILHWSGRGFCSQVGSSRHGAGTEGLLSDITLPLSLYLLLRSPPWER